MGEWGAHGSALVAALPLIRASLASCFGSSLHLHLHAVSRPGRVNKPTASPTSEQRQPASAKSLSTCPMLLARPSTSIGDPARVFPASDTPQLREFDASAILPVLFLDTANHQPPTTRDRPIFDLPSSWAATPSTDLCRVHNRRTDSDRTTRLLNSRSNDMNAGASNGPDVPGGAQHSRLPSPSGWSLARPPRCRPLMSPRTRPCCCRKSRTHCTKRRRSSSSPVPALAPTRAFRSVDASPTATCRQSTNLDRC